MDDKKTGLYREDIVACGITFSATRYDYWDAADRGLRLYQHGIDGWMCDSCLPYRPRGRTPECAVQQALNDLEQLKLDVLRNLGES
jgi:hypothetical protein